MRTATIQPCPAALGVGHFNNMRLLASMLSALPSWASQCLVGPAALCLQDGLDSPGGSLTRLSPAPARPPR